MRQPRKILPIDEAVRGVQDLGYAIDMSHPEVLAQVEEALKAQGIAYIVRPWHWQFDNGRPDDDYWQVLTPAVQELESAFEQGMNWEAAKKLAEQLSPKEDKQ